MTQEDRQLLLKDLCARLPYGVVVNVEDDSDFDGWLRPYTTKLSLGLLQKYLGHSFSILPYLRPMSSMTEEEEIYYNTIYTTLKFYEKEDWLNAHHFDYRGLIPMGLALEASKNMYKTE